VWTPGHDDYIGHHIKRASSFKEAVEESERRELLRRAREQEKKQEKSEYNRQEKLKRERIRDEQRRLSR
jgi:hypothetical protein